MRGFSEAILKRVPGTGPAYIIQTTFAWEATQRNIYRIDQIFKLTHFHSFISFLGQSAKFKLEPEGGHETSRDWVPASKTKSVLIRKVLL